MKRQALHTADIEAMDLASFLAFKSDREDDLGTTDDDIQNCDKRWLMLDHLEHAKDDELRTMVKRLKSDLWNEIQWKKRQREKKRVIQSKTDKLRNCLRERGEEYLFEYILPVYVNPRLCQQKFNEYNAFTFSLRNNNNWMARHNQDLEGLVSDYHRHLLNTYAKVLSESIVPLKPHHATWHIFSQSEVKLYGSPDLCNNFKTYDDEIRERYQRKKQRG